jgi:hypothetical protein
MVKKPGKNKSQVTVPEDHPSQVPGYLKVLSPDIVTVQVHARPGAKTCSISLENDVVNVSIDAPAREGEANAGIVEYMALVLGVKKSGEAGCRQQKQGESDKSGRYHG